MEETQNTELVHCLGCLCTSQECKLHDCKILYTHFWTVFEVNTIKLCYLCKRVAQRAELFVRNVQSNQMLLQNCVENLSKSIKEARIQQQPPISLSRSPLDPIKLTGKNNMGLKSTSRESKTTIINEKESSCGDNVQYVEEKDTEIRKSIKIEMEVEEEFDSLEKEPDNEYEEYSDKWVKGEDDYPLTLLKNELRDKEGVKVSSSRGISKQKERKNVKTVKKPNEPQNNESLGIEKILLSKEECMEERKQQALDPVYVNCSYKCEDCLKGFNFKAAYDNHRKRHGEGGGNPYGYPEGYVRLWQPTDYNPLPVSVQPLTKEMGAFVCHICKLRMDTEEKLLKHTRCHTIRYKCAVCGILRSNRSTLLDHHNVVHKKGEVQLPCPYCPKTFKRTMSRRRHVKYKHLEQERISCTYCLKSYANKEVMKAHMMAMHPKEVSSCEQVKRHACEQCGMLFRSATFLRLHSYKHSLTRDFYCIECDKGFKSETALKQHLKTNQAHVTYAELPMSCDLCEKRFSKRRELESHRNTVHLDVRPYKCRLCHKAYPSSSSLRDHTRTAHEGYKRPLRHPCNLCDKRFATTTILKAHIRTHTGERPYQCDKCPAQFSQSGALATHSKIHKRLARDGNTK